MLESKDKVAKGPVFLRRPPFIGEDALGSAVSAFLVGGSSGTL